MLATPHAQCLGPVHTRLSLTPGCDAGAASDAELGLRAVATGRTRGEFEGQALLAIDRTEIEVSAFKAAEDGRGSVLRLLNPTDDAITVTVTLGAPLAARISTAELVRLDEAPLGQSVDIADGSFSLEIGAHALASIRLDA